MRHAQLFGIAALVTLFVPGCPPEPIVAPQERFTYEIDAAVADGFEPVFETTKGLRPVAAMKDKNGVITAFIADEVILAPRDQAELNDFLTRYSGTILETDEMPIPPDRLNLDLPAEQLAAEQYAIRLDPSGFDLY